ncbi:hypothetical protein SCHPADRAFT_946770 [Schizopora paradoxa]|uniref:Uncharacterized protein n=1 Tax=Schizopora paradoxa TaxID=27342 RepID=A0A0H2R7X9_9AGAM|nr:hypothetical protein SCHPADRAFT_946770 [Schizopora paradoxa]
MSRWGYLEAVIFAIFKLENRFEEDGKTLKVWTPETLADTIRAHRRKTSFMPGCFMFKYISQILVRLEMSKFVVSVADPDNDEAFSLTRAAFERAAVFELEDFYPTNSRWTKLHRKRFRLVASQMVPNIYVLAKANNKTVLQNTQGVQTEVDGSNADMMAVDEQQDDLEDDADANEVDENLYNDNFVPPFSLILDQPAKPMVTPRKPSLPQDAYPTPSSAECPPAPSFSLRRAFNLPDVMTDEDSFSPSASRIAEDGSNNSNMDVDAEASTDNHNGSGLKTVTRAELRWRAKYRRAKANNAHIRRRLRTYERRASDAEQALHKTLAKLRRERRISKEWMDGFQHQARRIKKLNAQRDELVNRIDKSRAAMIKAEKALSGGSKSRRRSY